MELSAFARQVLTSARLEDKLVVPDTLTDRKPFGEATVGLPSVPGRPPRLRFDDRRRAARFPRPSELHAPTARGRALHFFANHELLAAELMALCLLRFPEAPAAFRRGVAGTLVEEQRHLRMYRDRMAALGVELGEVPVGGHFWRTLAGMESPLQYVAGMNLVFEQANLDHAAIWTERFRQVEDSETAALMQAVLDDEIGHVKHGAQWFERWRTPGPVFPAFEAALPPGLDPVRARGPVFFEAARRRAGVPDELVQALRDHRASRGRRPRLWVFWPDAEAHEAGRPSPSAAVRELTADLAPLFGILGSDDDLCLAPRPVDPAHRAQLASAGLPTPRLVPSVAAARGQRVDEVKLWGVSREARRRLTPLCPELRLPPPAAHPELLAKGLVAAPRRAWIAEGRLAADRAGGVARSLTEVERARAGSPVRVKAPFGASGGRQLRLRAPPTTAERGWIERTIRREGYVWVEPELDRVADFGLVIPPAGPSTLLRMLVDAGGAYRGHVLAPPERGLDAAAAAPLTRWAGGGIANLTRHLTRTARAAVPTGPVGVDLLIERRSEGYALQPLVEINARFTMGHIAAALRRRMIPGAVGVWAHFPRRTLEDAGASSFAELSAAWAPPRFLAGQGGPRIEGGVLPTNDPGSAQAVLTALSVAPTLDLAFEQLRPASLPD